MTKPIFFIPYSKFCKSRLLIRYALILTKTKRISTQNNQLKLATNNLRTDVDSRSVAYRSLSSALACAGICTYLTDIGESLIRKISKRLCRPRRSHRDDRRDNVSY
ncbi:hypothetical protein HI914_07132 [Erysiphe necator]|nr:hypothetical protein HI914_07132 [Erysiphe necator]